MRRVFSAVLAFCLCCSFMQYAIYAEDEYPDAGAITDESYRTLLSENEADSWSEIGGYIHNGEINLSDGIASYTPNSEDNGFFFHPTPIVNAAETKKIELRMRIPVKIGELKFYFVNEAGISEGRTFVIRDVNPSDEFQTININTDSNVEWTGNVSEYRISITGAVGNTFDVDYVRFYSDYNPTYTENDKYRLYDFNTKNYGFERNQFISDVIPYESELWMRLGSPDAALTMSDDEFSMDTGFIPQIRISYNNQTAGTKGKLYFITDTQTEYNEECSFDFEIVSGQGDAIIDTIENEQWKGSLKGLRLIPSDAEGVMRLGALRIDKFPCSIISKDGLITVKGNLYGASGRMSVKAVNTQTGKTEHSETIKTEDNGDFKFSFELPEASLEPTVYEIQFKATAFSGTYKKNVVYVSAGYVDKIFNEINTARTSGNADLVKTLIEDNYKKLWLNAEHYEAFAAEGQYMEELYKSLLGKTAADKEELSVQLNDAAVLLRVKYMSAEKWLNAIDDYDEYLKLKELPAYKTYEAAAVSVKEKIAAKMSGEHCTGFDVAREAFQKNVILTSLSNAVAWGDVKSILQTNESLLSVDCSKASSLKSPSEVYRQLTEKSFGTFAEVKNAFDRAVEEQKDKERNQNGGGGSSSSGGGSSSKNGFGIYAPQTNVVNTAPEPSVSPEQSAGHEKEAFDDLSGFDWAKNDITELHAKGIVSGTGNRSFEPSREVTREEFVKMLVSAFDLPLSTDAEFIDVKTDAWYAGYIGAAVKAKIVYGQGNMFGVSQTVSRQDVAVMAVRALNMEITADENAFTDYDEIADYAKYAVSALAQEGILTGYDDGMFHPQNALTRAEAAVIINRVIGRTVK